MESILQFDNVSYHYQDGSQQVNILNSADYTFEKGKVYAIVGASGSGKTTTIVLAGGLDQAVDGKVLFKGNDIKKVGVNNYRRNDVSIIFQSYNLIHYMDALHNVMNAIDISKVKVENKKEYAYAILEKLGLSRDESTRDIRKLSGGQQQRVAIARAIAKDVDLILADEPTGNLDSKNTKEIMRLFIQLAHEQGKCILFVTHSDSLAKACDVKLKIKEGKLIEV